MPGEFWWCSLRSDWSDSDQPWPLIGHKVHIGRVLTDLDSHLSQARMTDPGPESWADPDRLGKGFCSIHKLKLSIRHSPRKSFWPDMRYFFEASRKYDIFSRGRENEILFHWSLFLSTASLVMEWWDLIKINNLHAYLCLFIYPREGLCICKMHRYSLVQLDFQLKSGSLCIHILRSGLIGALLRHIFFINFK